MYKLMTTFPASQTQKGHVWPQLPQGPPTPDPYLKVADVDIEKDFDELISCYWTAWASPPLAVGKLTFPYLGTGSMMETQALKDRQKLLYESTRGDPSYRWVKVVDTQTGRIVAGALWNFYPTNPYRAPPPRPQAPWWPEGSEMRELTESMYRQLQGMRPQMMSTAHACGF